MVWRISALAALLAAGLLGAQVPGADPASEQIVNVKRVYVERFGGSEGADQIRDMVIATLQQTNLFALTESMDRADAVLRGSAEDLVYTENFQSSEGITARVSATGSTSSSSNRSGYFTPGIAIGDHDNVHKQERKHEASASLRLVNRDGDVIWSTIQESQGAKLHSAAADVAARISRQLAADYAKARERKLVRLAVNSTRE